MTALEKVGCFMKKYWTWQHKASDKISYDIEVGVIRGGSFKSLLIIFPMTRNITGLFLF